MCVQSCLFASPWTTSCQAPLSVEFSKQEYWSGLPFPTPGDLPDPGIKPTSFASPVLAVGLPSRRPVKYIMIEKLFHYPDCGACHF